MKKDRNSFFNESSYSYGYMPNMMQQPIQQGSYNQSFYNGPGYPVNYNTQDYSDIESRISKIERQINRIDSRLTKLETNTSMDISDNSNNMYMV